MKEVTVMRTGTMHHSYLFGDALFGASEKQWGWIMALGTLFVALGTIGLGMLLTVTVVSIFYLGVLLFVGGAAQALQAFSFHGWRNVVSHLLMGALYLAAAYVVIQNPLAASATLTLFLAAALVGLGIVRGATAIMHREYRQWGLLLFSGIVSVVLGVMIMASWPVSGLWAIGLYVAIDMICHGWSYIGLSLAVKHAHAH
jgi:uncharacterized membrane protein HdeD (DUF308 family)